MRQAPRGRPVLYPPSISPSFRPPSRNPSPSPRHSRALTLKIRLGRTGIQGRKCGRSCRRRSTCGGSPSKYERGRIPFALSFVEGSQNGMGMGISLPSHFSPVGAIRESLSPAIRHLSTQHPPADKPDKSKSPPPDHHPLNLPRAARTRRPAFPRHQEDLIPQRLRRRCVHRHPLHQHLNGPRQHHNY